MNDRFPGPEPGDARRFDERDSRGLPRWAKITVIVAGVAILLLVIVMLAGGGGHTPRRHGIATDGGPAPVVTTSPVGHPAGHEPLAGGHG